MDEAATQDIRIVELWPMLKPVLGTPSDPQLREAIEKLESWYLAGGHRRDLANKSISSPGTYEHNEAITIMDAWWPKLLEAEFRPALGSEAFAALKDILNFGEPYPGSRTGSAGLPGQLVRLRQQGPARPARRERPRHRAGCPLFAHLLRRRLPGSLPQRPAELAARSALGDAGAALRARRLRRKRAGELL